MDKMAQMRQAFNEGFIEKLAEDGKLKGLLSAMGGTMSKMPGVVGDALKRVGKGVQDVAGYDPILKRMADVTADYGQTARDFYRPDIAGRQDVVDAEAAELEALRQGEGSKKLDQLSKGWRSNARDAVSVGRILDEDRNAPGVDMGVFGGTPLEGIARRLVGIPETTPTLDRAAVRDVMESKSRKGTEEFSNYMELLKRLGQL